MRTKYSRIKPNRGRLQPLALAVLVAITVAGCATTPVVMDGTAPLLEVSRQWQDDLANERFSRALALVSDDFTSRAWPDKASLAEYFAVAEARGLFSNATVQREEVSLTLSSDVSRVYPLGIRADLGLAIFELSLRQEQSAWKITSLEMELY